MVEQADPELAFSHRHIQLLQLNLEQPPLRTTRRPAEHNPKTEVIKKLCSDGRRGRDTVRAGPPPTEW